jgi:hypothetical protein
LDDKDLEVDVAPFVDSTLVKNGQVIPDIITSQAEVFVGKKSDFKDWDRDGADKEESVDLNVMSRSSHLMLLARMLT